MAPKQVRYHIQSLIFNDSFFFRQSFSTSLDVLCLPRTKTMEKVTVSCYYFQPYRDRFGIGRHSVSLHKQHILFDVHYIQ